MMRNRTVVLAAVLLVGACRSVSELRCYPLGCAAMSELAPATFDPLAQDGSYEGDWGSRVSVSGDRVRFEWPECQTITARLGASRADHQWHGPERIRYPLQDVIVVNAPYRGALCNNAMDLPDSDLSAVIWRSFDRNGDYGTTLLIEPSKNYPSVRMGFPG
ncbi:hypothetical protein BH10PSE2_BH10PSE2_30700 [soil metagenome]